MYGREALRRLRERQAARKQPALQTSLLDEIPADAPMDDVTLTVWNGERFVAYDKWLATAPIVRVDEHTEGAAGAIPANATCVTGECSGVKVWLVRDGERWLMHVGSRKPSGRRRDFATPYLAHAIRTAEQWYGASRLGWRAEKGSDGLASKTADLPSQDSAIERGTGKQGHHDLDLEGRESER